LAGPNALVMVPALAHMPVYNDMMGDPEFMVHPPGLCHDKDDDNDDEYHDEDGGDLVLDI